MRTLGFQIFGLGAMLAFALFVAPAIRAQGPANIDDEVNRIAKELYCPVCPNTPLDVCNTQACAQWRAVIKEKLGKGESEQQIRAYFVAQYGERVLGAPPAEGFNLLAYILPSVALIAGGAVAWVTVRQWRVRRVEQSATPETLPIAREYADRIEKEMQEM